MTPPFNLPAPGRRHTLYIDFLSLQSAVFLVNSRLTLFTATRLGFIREGLHQSGRSFSRSYGANLPSS
jgi:hypothetical protein